MALPLSRDKNLVSSGPLSASIANNLQDAVISGARGLTDECVPAGTAPDLSEAAFTSIDDSVTVDGTGDPTWSMRIPFSVPAGAVLQSVTLFGDGAATLPLTLNVTVATISTGDSLIPVAASHETPTLTAGVNFSYTIDTDTNTGGANNLPYSATQEETLILVVADGSTQPAETYEIFGAKFTYYIA